MATDVFMKPGGKIVADTSSIIYLAKASALIAFCNLKYVITSQMIADELINRKGSINEGKADYKILNYNRMLHVVGDPLEQTFRTDLNQFTPADASVIALYYKTRSQGILTDDGQICRYCFKQNISFLNTPMALISLAKNDRISHKDLLNKLSKVYQLGRYSRFVYDYIIDYLENDYNV